MRTVAPLAAVAWLALAMTGCAINGAREATAPTPLPTGRVLVVGRVVELDNRAIADAAEDLVVRRLRSGGDVIGTDRWLQEASAAGAYAPAVRLLEGLRLGVSPVAEDVALTLQNLGLGAVLMVDVVTYEQIWGRYAKFTRVAVEAEAFQLTTRASLWRVRGFVETEARRGRAFQITLEDAVQVLTRGIVPGAEAPFVAELWRAWRR